MDNYNDFLSRMSTGFNSTGGVTILILAILLGIIVFFIVFFASRRWLINYRAARSINPANTDRTIGDTLRIRGNMNVAQIKAVYDLISDFKRKEIVAEAVPVSVLEHFAEYFYKNIGRLSISNVTAKRLSPSLFPLLNDSTVEIEIVHGNKIFIFGKKVLEKTDRKISVQKIENLSEIWERGDPVTISYITDKIYIRGDSRIINPSDREMLVLSYPTNLKISKERRFSRVPVQTEVSGYLVPANNPGSGKIQAKIRDISMEGLRIETGTVLKKNVIYLLDFEDRHFKTPYVFGNFECTVTKSMISGRNLFDYGLAFVYTSLENRNKLADYIKEWVDPFRAGAPLNPKGP